MTKHTEIKWVQGKVHPEMIYSEHELKIACCYSPDAEANARFIVKACNNYQLLVDTVKAVCQGHKDWQITVSNTYRHIDKDGEV